MADLTKRPDVAEAVARLDGPIRELERYVRGEWEDDVDEGLADIVACLRKLFADATSAAGAETVASALRRHGIAFVDLRYQTGGTKTSPSFVATYDVPCGTATLVAGGTRAVAFLMKLWDEFQDGS